MILTASTPLGASVVIHRSRPSRDTCSSTIVSFAFACCWAAFPTFAGDYPSKPIRIIVPYTAGSTLDARARVIANALGERLKQRPVVENKPGAGGAMGTAHVANSPPDGLTILFTNNSHAINPHVYRDPGYDAIKDFTPITQAYFAAMVLVVHPSIKAVSVKELAALAKARPGELTYASSGTGGVPHLGGELFKRTAGIDLLHIPYKGDAQALTDVLAGRVSMIFSGVSAAIGHVKAGKLRALGVTTRRRVAALSEVATVAESGYPSYEVLAWTGFFAPTGTPKAIVARLNREIVASLASAPVKAHMDATGAEIVGSSAAEFAAFVQKEVERYGKLVKEMGLVVE